MRFIVYNDFETKALLEIDLPSTAVVLELKRQIAAVTRRNHGKIQLKLGNNRELRDNEAIDKIFDPDRGWIVYLCYTLGERNLEIDLPTAAAKDILVEHGCQISILSKESVHPSFFIHSLSLSELSDSCQEGEDYVGILIYGRYSSQRVSYGHKVRPRLFIIKSLQSKEMTSFMRYREREGDLSNPFELVYQLIFSTTSVPDDLVAEGFLYENDCFHWNYDAFPARSEFYLEPKLDVQQAYRICFEKFLTLAWKSKEIGSGIKLENFLKDSLDPLHLARYFRNKARCKSLPSSVRSSFSSAASSSTSSSPSKSIAFPPITFAKEAIHEKLIFEEIIALIE